MTGRTPWGRTAARAVVAAVLFGLFAMHGLPGAMAAPAGSGHRDVLVAQSRVVGGTPATTAGDCAVEHACCVAVVRDMPRVDAPAPIAVATHLVARALRGCVGGFVAGSRAPPAVSLVGLGISRT